MENTLSWTDERVEMLKKLWAEGLSASQIAAKLGGVSRNAVIGKVHRLKLSGRAKSTKPSAPRVRRTPNAGGSSRSSNIGGSTAGSSSGNFNMPTRTAPSTTHAIGATALKQDHEIVAYNAPFQDAEDVVAPMPLKLKLTEINDCTCKWPYGDPLHGEFYFCGHTNKESSPYCSYHSKLAFQQPNDRRRNR
jgi:GcrA cell cycle regulator